MMKIQLNKIMEILNVIKLRNQKEVAYEIWKKDNNDKNTVIEITL